MDIITLNIDSDRGGVNVRIDVNSDAVERFDRLSLKAEEVVNEVILKAINEVIAETISEAEEKDVNSDIIERFAQLTLDAEVVQNPEAEEKRIKAFEHERKMMLDFIQQTIKNDIKIQLERNRMFFGHRERTAIFNKANMLYSAEFGEDLDEQVIIKYIDEAMQSLNGWIIEQRKLLGIPEYIGSEPDFDEYMDNIRELNERSDDDDYDDYNYYGRQYRPTPDDHYQ